MSLSCLRRTRASCDSFAGNGIGFVLAPPGSPGGSSGAPSRAHSYPTKPPIGADAIPEFKLNDVIYLLAGWIFCTASSRDSKHFGHQGCQKDFRKQAVSGLLKKLLSGCE